MNQEYRQDFLKAGALAKEVREYGKSLIKIGSSYNEVIGKILEKIYSLGARPAFPPQIALNDVAAHYLPFPGQDIIFAKDLVKLDIGVCYRGAIGDCAVTLDLSGKHRNIIDAAEAALFAAESIIKIGLPIREIGRTIADTIASFGLKPIKNLSGHGLGYYKIHTSPTIPNYDDRSSGLIKPGMTFAIEPFATNGKGLIYEEGEAMIFSLLKEKRVPWPEASSLLEKIKKFEDLPFSMHDLLKLASKQEIAKGLRPLLENGIVGGYGPLVEEGHGMVAQAENSVLVDEDGQVFVTTR